MNFRTLLLGSAAALMTVSAAQAADKTPARPAPAAAPAAPAVDYVRICSAFGTGYFFAPGLDTCIRLQGTVTFNLTIGDNRNPGHVGTNSGLDDDHEFTSAAALTVITTSNTEYGQLTGQFTVTANIDGYGRTIPAGKSTLASATFVDRDYTVGSAFVQLGPVLAGYTGSAFDISRGFTLDAGLGSNITSNQLRLAFALGNVGFLFAAEDYRQRYFTNVNPGASIASMCTSATTASCSIQLNNQPTGNIPDLVAAMTYQLGLVSGKFSVGFGDRMWKDSWGAGAGIEVDLSAIAKGDRLRGLFEYSAHTGEWIGLGLNYDASLLPNTGPRGNYYNYLVSFIHFWAQNGSTGAGALSSEFTASFRDTPSVGTQGQGIRDSTEVEFSSTYTLVRNLNLRGAVRWQMTEGTIATTTGQIQIQRSFP
ncbi:MAG: porin [Bauldia sp.]